MAKFLLLSVVAFLALHGLIHLMGLIAYWPLGKLSELPYKTTLLGGRWNIGPAGMRIFSMVWLLAGAGFLTAAIALALGCPGWAPVLLSAALLSLVVCILDWEAAFAGVWINLGLLAGLVLVFGLRVQPEPFPAFAAPAARLATVPLPAGLPAPVERYYRQTYGDRLPVYHSAVLSGRGTIRLLGITLPARMRFSHIAGQGYHHYIEANLYGLPVLKTNEWYLDGHNRMELPFGVVENDPCADSAANQGLWAETLAYPALFLTDPRVRWEAIDDTHARLMVPYGAAEQVFTIQFDPQTGELVHFETMRCHDSNGGTMRWWGEKISGPRQNGQPPSTILTAAWENEGTPWIRFEIEEMAFNADLSADMRNRGE